MTSLAGVQCRLEPWHRVLALDFAGEAQGQGPITVIGLKVAVDPTAQPGNIQATVGFTHESRRLAPPLGQIGGLNDLFVAVRDAPGMHPGGPQVAGWISIVEVAAGTLMSSERMRIRLVNMSDPTKPGGVFEAPPVLRASHGDIRLREGAGPSPTNVVTGAVDPADRSLADWGIWAASTEGSKLEVGAAGLSSGPVISISSSRDTVGFVVEAVDRAGNIKVLSRSVLGIPVASR